MEKTSYLITYDVGTTALKTCLFAMSESIELISYAEKPYPLQILTNGGVEQNPDHWWEAMAETTRRVLIDSGVVPAAIAGISFCSQMQGLVLVDQQGHPVRPSMSYMDQRAGQELAEGLHYGLKVSGLNAYKLLRSLLITRAVPASVKDPVWKYKWVERNEPEIFKRVYKWLDVKDFLILRCTGNFLMTADSAFATLLYDIRKGQAGFSKTMCQLFGVNRDHLPPVIKSTEKAGQITEGAAAALGLVPGIPVFGGGGDASLIGVGAGAVKPGSTHIYCGTSGWVSTVIEDPKVDTQAMIAAVVGAIPNRYHYFAELETAGKCLEWVKNHLALDEIGVYLEKKQVSESHEAMFRSLYDYMLHVIEPIPAGSGGVIFTPWLHGNRCPFEDANARGMFFNIGLDTGKTELIRAVLEGVCYHLRWMLEAQEKKVRTAPVVRFVGGGALAPLTCQILSDVLGRNVETVDHPQNVGAIGAALTIAVGLGFLSGLEQADELIQVKTIYTPNWENHRVYSEIFPVFKGLYTANKKHFAALAK